MVSLSTATLGSYRNGEFLQFMKNVMDIYAKTDINALMLSSRFNELTFATNEMDAVFMSSNAHELTPELQQLDYRRDRALIGIKLTLESQKYREDDAVVKASELLLSNYYSHGDKIDKLSYQQETAVVDALMIDWNTAPSLVAALVTVGLTEWVALLKTINTEFNEKYVLRAKTTVQPAQISIKRSAIKLAYDNLTLDTVSYSRVAADKKPYLEIIEMLNGLISDYNNSVNLRLAGRSTDTDTSGEDQVTDVE